ncbi:MAG TPA: hypothetical protein VN456_15235 [Desulfosporosinus sp.]|nr:hypothetical protein [Desulfosporosinus sp.]
MVVRFVHPKSNLHDNIVQIKITTLILMICILFFAMGAKDLREGLQIKEPVELSQTPVPLLINSGAVQAKEAEVSVVLWFENGEIPLGIWRTGPLPDWTWSYKESQTASGRVAVTLSGHQRMNKNEESNLYTWYTVMVRQLAQTGGQIYIDERVPQAIDISAYLSKTNALPAQWALSDSLVSIAAYQKNLPSNIMAGNDRINIQLLSRGIHNGGQTVLAIPVLLEEF